MDYLWSPWRYQYISANTDEKRERHCVFCEAPKAEDLASTLVLARAGRTFAILNLYPYTTGHLMIVPYAHVAGLTGLDRETTSEMMEMAREGQRVLEAVYKPNGFNVGINLGHAAGAGIREHIHMHVVPRWIGDANFVSAIGETRVIPEDLSTTYRKLAPLFGAVS